uniref:Uncharacterized protein n=1 Tax=Knipowitschia caucasica TaxID=637954 RepID=A0AAV2J0E8_KNICA
MTRGLTFGGICSFVLSRQCPARPEGVCSSWSSSQTRGSLLVLVLLPDQRESARPGPPPRPEGVCSSWSSSQTRGSLLVLVLLPDQRESARPGLPPRPVSHPGPPPRPEGVCSSWSSSQSSVSSWLIASDIRNR